MPSPLDNPFPCMHILTLYALCSARTPRLFAGAMLYNVGLNACYTNPFSCHHFSCWFYLTQSPVFSIRRDIHRRLHSDLRTLLCGSGKGILIPETRQPNPALSQPSFIEWVAEQRLASLKTWSGQMLVRNVEGLYSTILLPLRHCAIIGRGDFLRPNCLNQALWNLFARLASAAIGAKVLLVMQEARARMKNLALGTWKDKSVDNGTRDQKLEFKFEKPLILRCPCSIYAHVGRCTPFVGCIPVKIQNIGE